MVRASNASDDLGLALGDFEWSNQQRPTHPHLLKEVASEESFRRAEPPHGQLKARQKGRAPVENDSEGPKVLPSFTLVQERF